MGFSSATDPTGDLLASSSSRQGPGKQPGVRVSTVHVAGCALDAKRHIFS